jgi:hypothetical protein
VGTIAAVCQTIEDGDVAYEILIRHWAGAEECSLGKHGRCGIWQGVGGEGQRVHSTI